MKCDEFQDRLSEIEAKIETLSPSQQTRLLTLVEETKERHDQFTESFTELRSMLDDWRLTMKYLVFDLESTRLEVEQLRNEKNDD